MIPLAFRIFLLILIASALPARHDLNEQLHEEFTQFSVERLYRMINLEHGVVPEYLTVSVVLLNDCKSEKSAHNFVKMGEELMWDETTCGTEQMREWCDKLPGRAINLMTRDPISDKSFLSHFQCELPHGKEQKPKLVADTRTHWPQLIFPGFVFLCILGIIYNFRQLCKEQANKRRNMNMSFAENTQLIGECNKENPKKNGIRFDDNSDLSIGKVFTL